jgi:hypothetical protein
LVSGALLRLRILNVGGGRGNKGRDFHRLNVWLLLHTILILLFFSLVRSGLPFVRGGMAAARLLERRNSLKVNHWNK